MCYTGIIPRDKPVFNLAVDEALLKRLDDFCFQNSMNTRHEAIRPLLEETLKNHRRREPIEC
jgi:metal-responsive CopG/Arc/MetJ family transcriptional regulator